MLRALVMDSYDWFVRSRDRPAPTFRAKQVLRAGRRIDLHRPPGTRTRADPTRWAARRWPRHGWSKQGLDPDLDVVEWRDRSTSDGLFGIPGIGTLAAWALGFADAEHMMARFRHRPHLP